MQINREALDAINTALERIKARIEGLRSSIRVQHKASVCKLQIDEQGVAIKIEVNMVGRGLLGKPIKSPLCDTAQTQFDAFCVVPIVSIAQLYGGKLCAALDRQHPRDLFDVKLLFDNEGLSDEIKRGLLYGLATSSRPTHELLIPNLLDQRAAFESQFEGMSRVEFTYDDYETIRTDLIKSVRACLGSAEKDFLLGLNRVEPDWSIYDFSGYPAVEWKLLNLKRFKTDNPKNYQKQLHSLEEIWAD